MGNTYTDFLKMRMPALGDIGWDDEVNDNTKILDFVLAPILKGNVIITGLVPSDGGGLDVDITAGTAVVGGTSYDISADTLTCSANDKNYLHVDSTGALALTTTAPVGNYCALAMIDAGAAAIERFSDARAIAAGALAFAIDYTPANYALDTGEDEAINQHLSGIDGRFGLLDGFKNKLINGAFRFWQRAISQTAAGNYSVDRFMPYFANGPTMTFSRQAFADDQTDVPGYPQYYARAVVVGNSATNALAFFQQMVEDVRTLAGKTLTISFYAKASAALNVSLELVQGFGTGGSTGVDGIGSNKFSLTTSWAKYSFTFTVPDLTGITLGPDSYTRVRFWMVAGSDFDSRTDSLGNQSGTFEFALLQLEEGETATPFRFLPIPTELRLCQRYFQKTYPADVLPGTANDAGHKIVYSSGHSSSGHTINLDWHFAVEMRALPTVISYSPSTGAANYVDTASGSGAPVAINIGRSGAYVSATDSSGSTIRYLGFHATADAEL